MFRIGEKASAYGINGIVIGWWGFGRHTLKTKAGLLLADVPLRPPVEPVQPRAPGLRLVTRDGRRVA